MNGYDQGKRRLTYRASSADMIRIVRITADGSAAFESVPRSGETYRDIVGGWLERVTLPAPFGAAHLNEEAKMFGLAPNPVAERVLLGTGANLMPGDFLAGDAFFTGPVNGRGADTDVTPELLALLGRLAVKL